MDIKIIILLAIVSIIGYVVIKQYIDKIGSQEGINFNILNALVCPINIFKNANWCFYFYSLDMLMYIVWLVIWIPSFILYCLLFALTQMMCVFLKPMFGRCINLRYNDIVPSKKSVCNGLENIAYFFSGKRFLYRNKSDMRKCYCLPPIKYFFMPLDKFNNFFDPEQLQQRTEAYNKKYSMALMSFSIVILGLIAYNSRTI